MLPTISGYRCQIRNEQKGRKSNNHKGKAIDSDVILPPHYDKKDQMVEMEKIREFIYQKTGCQVGWDQSNRIALEPPRYSPTWIHADCRTYEPEYLDQRFFVKSWNDWLTQPAFVTDLLDQHECPHCGQPVAA